MQSLLTGRSLLHFFMAICSAALIFGFLRGWQPPFPFHENEIPERDLISRLQFEVVDGAKTEADREQARRQALCIYENDPEPIRQIVRDLRKQFTILSAKEATAEEGNEEKLTAEQAAALNLLMRSVPDSLEISDQEAVTSIRTLVTEHGNLDGGKLDVAIRNVLDPIAETGVITTLEHESDQGDQGSLLIDGAFVDVAKIRRDELVATLPEKVSESFQQTFETPASATTAKIVGRFIADQLPDRTLTYDEGRSEESRRKAEDAVEDAIATYSPSSRLAEAGKPLSRETELPILRAEHNAWLAQLSWGETIGRTLAFAGMLVAVYLLCGWFIQYQYQPELLVETPQLFRLLATVVVTGGLASYLSIDPLRAELVPLLLCVFTLTIAFGRQVALLVTTCLTLVVSLGLGSDIGNFVTVCSGVCTASLLVGRIRTRTKLIYVGLAAAGVVAATNLGVAIVQGKLHLAADLANEAAAISTTGWGPLFPSFLQDSLRCGGLTLLAAATMTGILPFVERAFGVQTDLSLLELGDASHQLLRQLAQRAPGTYNHSINVAAIAEAAADAIGGHGLLTRVGAYFHDIGKMFKPNYFIENQEQGGNRHDQLQPAMSTLVIIAHVKDGADLARQHRLPKPIIDFIEQHHGTTLVEYFFRQAEKRSQDDPNKEEVSETSFRYPGPKPQTLEAAVLMLADSVESASRTLVEPTPSRIQNLVDDIAMKKLLDGQFDQCGLTLQQLDQLKTSLVKSLTAIYHGRVKYSGQASA